MENLTNTKSYHDEEDRFISVVLGFVLALLFVIVLSFSIGFKLAKNKYSKPVDHIQTTQVNIT